MELLTTVVLAGIVVALAIPSYSRFVASSRVTDQTYELVGALNFARSEAIRRNATLTLCRAADDTATACTEGDNWGSWILRTNAGAVLRRGTFDDFGDTLRVSASLTEDRIAFSPDGLARTGGVLLNSSDDDAHFFLICSTRYSSENVRRLTLGASSRITTTRESAACS